MSTTNTPKEIDDSVINFCKSITPYSIPEYVQLSPESWCKQNECYDNVKQKVEKFGGKAQMGWRIQVIPDPFPKYMIEAVHHTIWISKTGKKLDITPQPESGIRIVFVSDDSTQLGKHRIGEKYHPLLNCPLVKKYVRLCNLESVKYVSKTELIKQPKIPFLLRARQFILLLRINKKHFGK